MVKIEIDQSGKIEQLDTHTVIAGSNGEQRAIFISAGEKRKIIQRLRKSLIPSKDLLPILFSVLIFLLLKKFGRLPTVIIIDEEYTGKDKIISESLKKLLSHKKKEQKMEIKFGLIGKSSPAHSLAWSIHRRKRSLGIRISSEEILNLIK